MSLRDRPLGKTGLGSSIVPALTRALGAVKAHFETWPRRYVEMRVEARERSD